MKIEYKQNPAPLRRREYPSIEDQLEAIWALLPATARDSNPVYQKIIAVKAKYPKPTK